jgi:hypothetical protein
MLICQLDRQLWKSSRALADLADLMGALSLGWGQQLRFSLDRFGFSIFLPLFFQKVVDRKEREK